MNSFGGYIKQYEVAINPDKLNAQNVSISQVYEALARNNVNTGGAYIEKNRMSNFIRGEKAWCALWMISEKIVIKTENGIPVTVGDVASKYTSAARCDMGLSHRMERSCWRHYYDAKRLQSQCSHSECKRAYGRDRKISSGGISDQYDN